MNTFSMRQRNQPSDFVQFSLKNSSADIPFTMVAYPTTSPYPISVNAVHRSEAEPELDVSLAVR